MPEPLADLRLRDFAPVPMLTAAVTEVNEPAAPIVDVHNHLGRRLTGVWRAPDPAALIATMDEAGVATIVNLDGEWGDELEANLDRYDRSYPGRFVTFARLDWADTSTAGWGDRMAASLEDSVRRGAAGLKLWKDIGLRIRDEHDQLVFLDDPRLEPLWAALAAAGVPALIHTADPVAFFQPLDARNERVEELLRHPDWHFHGAEFPPLQRLLDALEAVVTGHPDVRFIGAHVGCLAENLDWVEQMLDRCPNYRVDIAARLAEIGRQPRRTRALIERHPDRVLLGTDCAPPELDDYRMYQRFLETADEAFPYSSDEPPPTGRWTISGLGLPAELAAAVEGDNARAFIPALAGSSARGSDAGV
ncbi:amidohydrolase family protein [Kribbella sp. NPDC000426]|uniref:amidohydrolase family protein n=1 Tax=Kribbella sp. NPDC000426 TaxID=3154255 RepID=UPI00331CC660